MMLDNGQLCVIDFGLMATLEKKEMDAMVSAIVHLANRDWPKVVKDFVTLGFLPEDADTSQIEPVLGAILDQALEGGGAKAINFQSLSEELATVTFDFPFSIPPAFALLLRALSVLEGIALVGDPDFRLVMEAFPFVSRLIMTDRSPALRDALRQILYKDGSFSPTRLRVLLDSSQGLLNEGDAFVDFDTLSSKSTLSKDAVDFLFSTDGTVIREILVEELAKGLDVLGRDLYYRNAASFGMALPSPVRNLIAGTTRIPLLPLPFIPQSALLSFAIPPVSVDERTYLNNMREIVEWLTEDNGGQRMSPRMIAKLLPDIAVKSQVIGREVAGLLGETFVRRLFNDVLRGGGEDVAGRRRVM